MPGGVVKPASELPIPSRYVLCANSAARPAVEHTRADGLRAPIRRAERNTRARSGRPDETPNTLDPMMRAAARNGIRNHWSVADHMGRLPPTDQRSVQQTSN